ncbi:EamA family transporter [Demequina sp. B12]|uniref:EamA family transporter n=1 Tax=Demequina sp. B12 TaxID=2992757 RepID=UPI00237A1BEC|nr:EamA family transporter [Demequina sp. B12]MDE0573088.1 EamA family transporter [Demequina sp. B12]
MNRPALIATTAIAPILWGTTYLVTTELLPEGRPLLASVARALPVGLVLIAATRSLPRGDWWWKSAILGTLNIGAFFALLFISAYRLPGGVAATLGAVHPLIVGILAVVVLKEGSARRTLAAALLGLAGVALLVLTPGASADAVGVVAGLAAGTSTAAGVILTKRWGRPTSLAAFTGWQLTWGGLILIVPLIALEGLPSTLTNVNLAGLAWLAIAGGLVSYLLWFRGILALPASQVSSLAFLAPLTAALLGWYALQESLTPLQLSGAVLIVVAVSIGQGLLRRPHRPGRAQEDSAVAVAASASRDSGAPNALSASGSTR